MVSFNLILIIYPAITISSLKSNSAVFPIKSKLLDLLNNTSPFLTTHFSNSSLFKLINFKSVKSNRPSYVKLLFQIFIFTIFYRWFTGPIFNLIHYIFNLFRFPVQVIYKWPTKHLYKSGFDKYIKFM